jgi:hypothetical protein
VWEWAVSILEMDDSTEVDLGDEVVVEKEVGSGGDGE